MTFREVMLLIMGFGLGVSVTLMAMIILELRRLPK